MKHLLLLGLFAVAAHSQTLPLGVVVTMPSAGVSQLGVGLPQPNTYVLLLTRELPNGAQASTVVNSALGPIPIWNNAIAPPTFFLQQHCAMLRSPSCLSAAANAGPDFYVIASGPSTLLFLSGTTINATITPPGGAPFQVTTGSLIRGIEQSTDHKTITIYGTFDPSAATSIYFGLWPVAVAPHAITVAPDHITIDASQDQSVFNRSTGGYALTVLQSNICDSAMFQYQSAFASRIGASQQR